MLEPELPPLKWALGAEPSTLVLTHFDPQRPLKSYRYLLCSNLSVTPCEREGGHFGNFACRGYKIHDGLCKNIPWKGISNSGKIEKIEWRRCEGGLVNLHENINRINRHVGIVTNTEL